MKQNGMSVTASVDPISAPTRAPYEDESAGVPITGAVAHAMTAVHTTVRTAHHDVNFRLKPRSCSSCQAVSGTVTAKHSRLGMR